jgi:hypothetical protein
LEVKGTFREGFPSTSSILLKKKKNCFFLNSKSNAKEDVGPYVYFSRTSSHKAPLFCHATVLNRSWVFENALDMPQKKSSTFLIPKKKKSKWEKYEIFENDVNKLLMLQKNRETNEEPDTWESLSLPFIKNTEKEFANYMFREEQFSR